MRHDSILVGPCGHVHLMDSITELTPSDAGAVAVSGSHGGASSARYALEVPVRLAVFNDAGVGKDAAGIVGLIHLQAQGRAAVAVLHTSARIGDAQDTWQHGVISHCNQTALALGLRVGRPLQTALQRLVQARSSLA